MQNNTKTRFKILFNVCNESKAPGDSVVPVCTTESDQVGPTELEKLGTPQVTAKTSKSKIRILFETNESPEKVDTNEKEKSITTKKPLKIVFSAATPVTTNGKDNDIEAMETLPSKRKSSKIRIEPDKADPKKLGFSSTQPCNDNDDLYLEGEKRHGHEKNRTIAYPVTLGIILAEEYRSGPGRTPCVNPTGWWASEKYDGIRVLWDGISLWTRAMNQVNAPVSFQSRLPPGFSLDGELFIKRDHFNETSGIVRNKIPNLEDWEPMKLMVFDIPHLGHVYPFEKRLEILKETVHRYGEPLVYVNHIRVKSAAHLDEIHRSLLSKGAEGTMIRAPRSYYEADRSMTLLKVKDQYDAECIVEGWEEGKNRNQGHLGALEISWEDPVAVWERYGNEHDSPYHGIFKVGSGLTQVERVPIELAPELFPRGTRIRVAFSQLQKSGKPKHPAYKGRV